MIIIITILVTILCHNFQTSKPYFLASIMLHEGGVGTLADFQGCLSQTF